MPHPSELKVGDLIRILRVPENDLRDREQELATGSEIAGWTANTIERIIESQPVVEISEIDEYGGVWYSVVLTADDGSEEYHSLSVFDDDSWEIAR
jgi:hypothetical protein